MTNRPPEHHTKFVLMRHALTDWNESGRIQGQTDTVLSEAGIKQARKWGRSLENCDFELILCSDLTRASQTAEIVNSHKALDIISDSRLREQDWGEWASCTLAEIQAGDASALSAEIAKGWDFRPPGGESRRQVLARSLKALEKASDEHAGKTILVVTHQGVIKVLVHHFLKRGFDPAMPKTVKKYRLHCIVHDGQTLHLTALNERL